MSGNTPISTTVQNGETLSLYANMYGCSVEDIQRANNLSGDRILAGQRINIPIGERWQPLPTSEEGVLQRKLSYFNDRINDIHMQLYNPDLRPEEREILEQQYIDLVNQKKERDKVAEFSLSGNGINIVLNIKEDITVEKFRELFPECTTTFYAYADRTHQREYVNGQGWFANPKYVVLRAGETFMVRSQDYAKDDGDGFGRSFMKTMKSWFGINYRLDGK